MFADLEEMNRDALNVALQYSGGFAFFTVIMLAVLVTLYVMVLCCAVLDVSNLALWVVAVAILTYMSYTPLHEAVHGNICGRHKKFRWINEVCGYIAGQILLIPFASHRVEHSAHHRHTNDPVHDPDYMLKGMGRGSVNFVRVVLRFLWMQISFVVSEKSLPVSWGTKIIYSVELVIALSWRLLLFRYAPLETTMLHVGYLLGLVFTTYWFAYRPHAPYEQRARFKNTCSMLFPRWARPLEWFWLGQNLHSIHHAFPRVPFYFYRNVFREIEPVMRANGNAVIDVFSGRHVIA
ncbi:fatty acid desaturase [Spongiibacter sp.]|uniref:fatty acid desaturase family protein n=1 Tax=Spongiibacter sp. TaxID=2024860 RepID=UPI00356A8704